MESKQQEHRPEHPVYEGVEFRPIPGFSNYLAGTDGRILSCLAPNKKARRYLPQWREKKTWRSIDGYFLCCLWGDDGREHRKLSHTLILETFVGPRPKGYDCCHGNGIPDDNRIENLRWGTRKENVEDSRRHGTLARRERSGSAKLNADKAEAIIALTSNGWTQRRLADLFNVSQGTVSAVILHKRWSDDT